MGKLPYKYLQLLVSGALVMGATAAHAQYDHSNRRSPALNPGGSGKVFHDNPTQRLGTLDGGSVSMGYAPAPSMQPMSPPPANYADSPLMPAPLYDTASVAPYAPTPMVDEQSIAPPPAMQPMPNYSAEPYAPTASYEPDLVPMTQEQYSFDTDSSYPVAAPQPLTAPAGDPNAYYETQESVYVPPAPMAGATLDDGAYTQAYVPESYAMAEPYQPEPSQVHTHYAPQQSVNPYRTLAPSRYEARRVLDRQFRNPKRHF